MSRPKSKRFGRGTLFLLGLLFFSSGLLRLADGTGSAMARGVETIAERVRAGETESAAMPSATCEPSGGLAGALATLRTREAEIERREAEIEARMVALQRADAEIAHNLAALKDAETRLEATIALADGAAESDIDRLTKVYENMKSKEAAMLFEQMDPTFASGFLGRMKPDVAAAILAGMTPQAAYTLSVVLAGRNSDVPTN